MVLLKYILKIVLVSVLLYGLIGQKSIAYCCGHCHLEKVALTNEATEATSCCHHSHSGTDQSEVPDDCANNHACHVFSPNYDWVTTTFHLTQLPDAPVFDILFFTYDTIHPELFVSTHLKEEHSPPPNKYQEESLSYLCRFII